MHQGFASVFTEALPQWILPSRLCGVIMVSYSFGLGNITLSEPLEVNTMIDPLTMDWYSPRLAEVNTIVHGRWMNAGIYLQRSW